MKPSSRTPEGEDNICPVCGHAVRIEPSRPPGDAPCPDCGYLMWFPTPWYEQGRYEGSASRVADEDFRVRPRKSARKHRRPRKVL